MPTASSSGRKRNLVKCSSRRSQWKPWKLVQTAYVPQHQTRPSWLNHGFHCNRMFQYECDNTVLLMFEKRLKAQSYGPFSFMPCETMRNSTSRKHAGVHTILKEPVPQRCRCLFMLKSDKPKIIESSLTIHNGIINLLCILTSENFENGLSRFYLTAR
jgi:hypothetical protein